MPNDLIGGILPRQIPVNAPEEDLIGGVLPRQIPSISPTETLPEEMKPVTPVPSLITTFSGMVGEAASRLGKATGLPNLENIGEDIKTGTKIMETEGMEAVGKVPGASELTGFYGGMTGEQLAPTAPLPEDAGMIRQATVGAARLLGMGVALTPIGRALRGIGLAAPIAGAISLGGYGALEKLPDDASRLGHIATMAAFGFAFPLAGSALQAVASKIPAIGNVFAKVKAGVPLSSGEVAIKKAVEVGQSSMLMGGAGAAEGKTWEERTQNFFLGFLTGGLAHVATDAGSKAFGLAKDTKLPVGKGLNIEEALKNPEVSETERRLAGTIIGNRMSGKAYINKALWEEFVKEKIANKSPINPVEFDDFISREWNRTSSEIAKTKTLSDVEQMTLNQKLQTMPTERTPEENERALADIVKDKIDKGMLLSSDEIVLSKKHGLLRDADIELISAITPKKPMTEQEISAQPKIIPTEEVAVLRAKLRAREITTGKEAGVKEIPVGIKPTGEPEIIKEKPVEKGTILTPEIQVAQEEQKIKSLETLTDEELNNRIKSGELDTKWLYRNVRNMSPEFVKRINAIVPIPEFKFPELPKRVGKVSLYRFGYDIAEGRHKVVEVNIKQALETGIEPLALKEAVADQEARIVPEYASEADKDIIRDYFKNARESIDKLAKEVIPAKGMMAGKLPYSTLKETGKALYDEGKNTFDAFRKSFIELYGQEGFSTERNNILKAFNEIRNEIKIAKPEGDGYRISDERAAGQEHETFQDEIRRRFATEYSDVKDNFRSYLDRNVERMKDFIRTVPDESKEQLVNKMAKNIGFGSFVKSKISEWIKVPIWDAELAPTIKGLKKLTSRATEISNEFLRRNEFLKGYKLSQNMVDAIINTTLKDKPTGFEKLNPLERKMVDKLFENTKWMLSQFEHEMRMNGDYLKSVAKKAGFENVDDYITDFIGKHKRDFYFPLLRGTGDYVVYAKGNDGKTAWAENFDSVIEAKKRALELMNQLPDHEVNMFNAKQKYGFKFPELLEMLHDLPYMRNVLKSKISPEGATETDKKLAESKVQELEDILSGSYLEIWAKGRLAKREGIKGFSTDIRQVLDQYAENFPRSFVRRWNAGRIADLVEGVPEDKQQYAKNTVDYYLGRTGYEGNLNFAIRNVIYNWNLAFKPSFAVLNLTQRGATTLWRAVKELPGEGGMITLKSQMKELGFYKEMLGKRFQGMSTRDIINGSSVFNRAEKDTILRMHDRGELDTLRNLEIIGRNKLSRAINILATVSEKSNRVHSALTAIEIGRRKGYSGEALYDYATDFIYKTQWLYGKENRPVIGRGWKAPLFVFKTYMFNDLNFLKDLYPNKKAFSGAIATRLALGGLGGIYGMGAITSAIDWAMINIVGKKDWDLSKEETMKLLEDKYGKGLVDVATRGLPTMVGLEGSITFGSPELFDIAALPLAGGTFRNMKMLLTEQGIDWKEFIRRNVPTVVKHQFEFSTKTIFGKEKITRDDIKSLPIEIRKRCLDIYNEMPKDMGDKEKMLYSIGFSTTTPTDYYNAINAIKSASREIRKYKAGVHREIGRAIAENRRNSVRDLIEDAKARGIKLNMTAIMEQAKKYKITEMMEEETEEE